MYAPAGTALGPDFMDKATLLEHNVGGDPDLYLVERQGREYLIRREGECDFSACDAACCSKLCLRDSRSLYLEGFADSGRVSYLVDKRCRYLRQDLTCRRYQSENYPQACINFPVPAELLYLEVMESCTFVFTMVRELTERRRQE